MGEGSRSGAGWLRAILVCTVAGIVLGGAIGFATSGAGEATPGEVSGADLTATVRYYRCPELGPLDLFHGGDRVYLTGRDEAGDWVQVREPYDLGARVWIPSAAVAPDGTIDALPVEPCAWEPPPRLDQLNPPEEPTGTEPTPSSEPEPSEPEPEPTPPESEPEPEPTEVARPVVEAIVADPADIWELGCISPVSQVRAVVRGDVDTVTLTWSVGEARGSAAMRFEAGDWVAEVGDFPARTVDPTGPGVEPVTLTVEAVDPSGVRVTETTTEALRLHLCD